MTKPLIKIFSSDRYNRIDTCNNFFFNPANKEMAGVQRCSTCSMLHGQDGQQMLNLYASFPGFAFVF